MIYSQNILESGTYSLGSSGDNPAAKLLHFFAYKGVLTSADEVGGRQASNIEHGVRIGVT